MVGVLRYKAGQALGILQSAQALAGSASSLQMDALSLFCQRTNLRNSGQLLASPQIADPSVGEAKQ